MYGVFHRFGRLCFKNQNFIGGLCGFVFFFEDQFFFTKGSKFFICSRNKFLFAGSVFIVRHKIVIIFCSEIQFFDRRTCCGGNGTDAYGFSALPAGYRDDEGFYGAGYNANFWSTTEFKASFVGHMFLFSGGRTSDREAIMLFAIRNTKDVAFSVRCVKN